MDDDSLGDSLDEISNGHGNDEVDSIKAGAKTLSHSCLEILVFSARYFLLRTMSYFLLRTMPLYIPTKSSAVVPSAPHPITASPSH